MPKEKKTETGKSVVLDLLISVVETEDVKKIISVAKEYPNKEVDGLLGVTWNNSNLYSLDFESLRALTGRIINKAEIAVKGRPDFLILKVKYQD